MLGAPSSMLRRDRIKIAKNVKKIWSQLMQKICQGQNYALKSFKCFCPFMNTEDQIHLRRRPRSHFLMTRLTGKVLIVR